MNRLAILALGALALPGTLAAQLPTAGNPITGSVKRFGYYGNWLLAAFDSIPASRYAYKPTAPQQSVGYIAQHLEDANYQLCSIFGPTKHVMAAKDSVADTSKATWPKDTLTARLRRSLLFCRDAVESLDDAKLGEAITVGPPERQRSVPRAVYVMLFLTDLAEHYAQIASYMRLLGMVPPSALLPQ